MAREIQLLAREICRKTASGSRNTASVLAPVTPGSPRASWASRARPPDCKNTASGLRNTASGQRKTAYGSRNTASGCRKSASGSRNTASALAPVTPVTPGSPRASWASRARPPDCKNTASGSRNTASGSRNTASGSRNTASGYRKTASGSRNTASGCRNTGSVPAPVTMREEYEAWRSSGRPFLKTLKGCLQGNRNMKHGTAGNPFQ